MLMRIVGASSLLLLLSAGSAFAEQRWITVTYKSGKQAKVLFDSERVKWFMLWKDGAKPSAQWTFGNRIFETTEPSDIAWIRTLLPKGTWIRVEWLNDAGRPAPNPKVEKYWRWSNIIKVMNGAGDFVEMWAEGTDTVKPTDIRVHGIADTEKVRQLAGLMK